MADAAALGGSLAPPRPQAILEAESPDTLADGIQLAARIVTRRGAVVVGPRGRPRTFLYRGRPLAVLTRPAFVYPPGYRYRLWAVGALVPAALFASAYYFTEWQAAGLRAPPPAHQWVRHGPDLLLIDTRNGKVIEVVPGAISEEG